MNPHAKHLVIMLKFFQMLADMLTTNSLSSIIMGLDANIISFQEEENEKEEE